MKREEDMLGRMIAMISRLARLDADQAAILEDQIRQEFGGEQCYIQRASWGDLLERDEAVRRALSRGETVRKVAAQYCIGVATVLRIRDSS